MTTICEPPAPPAGPATIGRRSLLAATLAGALVATAAASLTSCESRRRPQFRNTDITGADFAKGFSLTGADGMPHSLEDFRGKVVVVFFGYTQCPDVCPTTMAEMAAVMKQLGADAERVQVLFITVDPERDTPDLLARYVPAFDPRFLGLTGDAQAIARVAREFKVFYQKVPGKNPGSYTVDHTAGSYVFDPAGRVRLFVKHGEGPEALAHDIELLLDGKTG